MQIVPLVTEAATCPVELAEAKAFCDVQFDDDDAKLGDALATAFDWLQPPSGCLRQSIAEQTLCIDLHCWPLRCLHLPAGPATTIEHVKYFDVNNAEQTLDASNYFLDRDTLMLSPTFTSPALYMRPSAVRVTYKAGLASLPPKLKTAILRITKQLYDFRDELVAGVTFDPEMFGVGDLIRNYRVR